MSLIDQWNLANDQKFQQRVQSQIVASAVAIYAESVNDVQQIATTGTATGGTFTTSGGPLATAQTISWNDTAGGVQATLQKDANVGIGNVVVTGGPLPATPIQITWCGNLGNIPVKTLVLGTNTLTGTGSPAPSFTHPIWGVSVPNRAARSALAKAVLNNPAMYTQTFCVGIAQDTAVTADYIASVQSVKSDGVTDAHMANAVASLWNAYS